MIVPQRPRASPARRTTKRATRSQRAPAALSGGVLLPRERLRRGLDGTEVAAPEHPLTATALTSGVDCAAIRRAEGQDEDRRTDPGAGRAEDRLAGHVQDI